MSEERIPVAVIGAGNMGTNHVRVYDELPNADLVEVVEPDTERAEWVRTRYDAPVWQTIEDVEDAVAATVAVPNKYHRDIVIECLEAGLDVLVEKPLALTSTDAEAIFETAVANDAILQVGHIEQYNPAVETLRELLSDQRIIAVEAHRLGPFNEHLSEESVVVDLMIHDIDIVESIVEGDVDSVSAFGTKPKSDTLDHAVAQLQFENGVLGTLTASHVTHNKVRQLAIVTEEMYVTLDYQKQDISIQKTGSEEVTSLLGHSGYRTETVTESPYINRREPLKNELEDFIDCVTSRSQPRVDGCQGIRAVERAEAVLESFEDRTVED